MFHLYGLLIGIGIIISTQISAWLARRRNYPQNIIWDSFWWVIIPAIIGARLYHVFDLWGEYYSVYPIEILYIWNGGLAIFGALIGGFLGLYLYWRFKIKNFQPKAGPPMEEKLKIQFLALLNLISFSLPLAQSIGRLGNYVNKELFGLPSSLPWAIRIGNQTYHPLFAYEAIWLLIGFLIMYLSERDPSLKLARSASWRRKDGPHKVLVSSLIRNNYFAFYLIWYGFGRFFLEFLRPDEFIWQINFLGININMAAFLSLLIIIIGFKLMVWMKKN